jgi:Tetratricopeptide repeat
MSLWPELPVEYTCPESFRRQTLAEREGVLGVRHSDTLESRDNLAVVLQNQCRYIEASELYVQTLKERKEVLGERHPAT